MGKKITTSEFNSIKNRTNSLSNLAKLQNTISVTADFTGKITKDKFNNLSDAIFKLESQFSENCCQSVNNNCCQSCQRCQTCQGCQSQSCQTVYCQSCQGCQTCQSTYQCYQCSDCYSDCWGTH